MGLTRKLAIRRLLSAFVAFGLSSVAFADVEITARARNVDGDIIRILVSGDNVNGNENQGGVRPGLTGFARLFCRGEGIETIRIVGSDPSPKGDSGGILGCPIRLFGFEGGVEHVITVNPCDTPATIGTTVDFGTSSCAGKLPFGETAGDRVSIDFIVEP